MNNKKYNWLLYLITATILTTIAVQLYWNYKNYEQNKQRVLNEIQQSLDDTIEKYYDDLSKENIITIVEEESNYLKSKRKNIFKELDDLTYKGNKKDSTPKITFGSIKFTANSEKGFRALKSQFIDSTINTKEKKTHYNLEGNASKKNATITGLSTFRDDKKSDITVSTVSKKVPVEKLSFKFNDSISPAMRKASSFSIDSKSGDMMVDTLYNKIDNIRVIKGKYAADSIRLIKGLQTVFIALKSDTLKYNKIDSILATELHQKNIRINYAFEHYKKDTLFSEFNPSPNVQKKYSALSKSTYFAGKQNLKLNYTNPTLDTLKRSSTGILLSLLLSLAIISSLFYLLKIINQQKQLAEIKNDLISNITHEFKTPIATVSTAVEALENFNAVNDTEKTKKYLNISSVQLKKLHGMVEKLLETATLDSEKLLLNKEAIDIVGFTEKVVNKHKLIAPEKDIQFFTNTRELFIEIDNFHLENAVSNLIDNAVKYGGNDIDIAVTTVLKTVEITVADNGKGIDKSQQEKIFDKFYRVPKGNVHDVKGFGIGLYYTKKIIEKHNGTIELTSKSNSTVFKVILPNH